MTKSLLLAGMLTEMEERAKKFLLAYPTEGEELPKNLQASKRLLERCTALMWEAVFELNRREKKSGVINNYKTEEE